MQLVRSLGMASIAFSLLAGATGAAAAATTGAATTAATAGTATAATAAAATTRPAFVPYNYWGWVNVTTATGGTYTPAAINRGNSTGHKNKVNHPDPGYYIVTMKGLANYGGNVQVSSLGGPHHFCRSAGWSALDADEVIHVECFNASSIHADATFTVQFIYTNYESHRFAYLWADNLTDNYDTTGDDSPYSYNSASGPNHVTRSGLGHYVVRLPGLGVAKGDVQVTSYHEGALTSASEPAGITFTDCKVTSWSPSASDLDIYVSCFDVYGYASDSQFNLIFTEHAGLKGPGGSPFAYLLAQKPAAASYTPKAAYRFSSAGHAPTITRQGTGKYTATLTGMPAGGTVKVTAYGISATRCTVKSIRTGGTPQKVHVNCWTMTGTAADSKFTLSYER